MASSIRWKMLAAALAVAFPLASAHATTLTYQGSLQQFGKPAEGNFDIELTLYPRATGGDAVTDPLTLYAVPVHAGSFSAEADFGSRANAIGSAFVGVKVRTAGSGDFVALDTRSPANVVTAAGTCSAWAIDGNAGNPAGSYLGTSDAQPLILKSNNDPLITIDGIDIHRNVTIGVASTATGYANVAIGHFASANANAAVALGSNVQANADESFAFGSNAISAHQGAIVFADFTGDPGTSFTSTAPNQFIIRASGGVGIGTSTTLHDLDVAGVKGASFVSSGTSAHSLFPVLGASAESTSGLAVGVLAATHAPGGYGLVASNKAGGTAIYAEVVAPFGNPVINTSVGAFLSVGGVWANASDRNLKSGFSRLDPLLILSKVVALPVTSWFYKSEGESVRHVGPVAQDFSAAFGLGNSDKAIGTVDEGGVALAAIQGLNQKLERENAKLHAELDALRARVDALPAAKGE